MPQPRDGEMDWATAREWRRKLLRLKGIEHVEVSLMHLRSTGSGVKVYEDLCLPPTRLYSIEECRAYQERRKELNRRKGRA